MGYKEFKKMEKIEGIKPVNGCYCTDGDRIEKLKSNPTVINYLKVDDLTDAMIHEIFSMDIDNLFTDVLVKNSCMYNYLLNRYYKEFNKLPSSVTFNQDLVNELVLFDPNFVRCLFKEELYGYLTEFVLEIFVAFGNYVRLSEIPEHLLTENLILLALSRSDKAIKKLGALKTTDFMRQVSCNHQVVDKTLFSVATTKMGDIRKTFDDQEALEVQRRQLLGLVPKFQEYFLSSDVSIASFCSKNDIDVNLFKKYIELMKALNLQMGYEASNLNKVHASEGWNYVQSIVTSLKEALYKGVASPETKKTIQFNAALYYIYYSMDLKKLLDVLKSGKCNGLYYKVLRKVEEPSNSDSIKSFYNTKISYVDGSVVSETEKNAIRDFMLGHGMPLTSKIAYQVLKLWRDGDISLDKTYAKEQTYELDYAKRSEISDKVGKIRMQESIIASMDEKISALAETRKALILQW